MKPISTKKDVAEKVFGVDYNTLYRWCRYGVPKVRRQVVDKILCKIEQRELGGVVVENKELRIISLNDPASFRRRLKRLFPIFLEN